MLFKYLLVTFNIYYKISIIILGAPNANFAPGPENLRTGPEP
jgi:hypothetical protein